MANCPKRAQNQGDCVTTRARRRTAPPRYRWSPQLNSILSHTPLPVCLASTTEHGRRSMSGRLGGCSGTKLPRALSSLCVWVHPCYFFRRHGGWWRGALRMGSHLLRGARLGNVWYRDSGPVPLVSPTLVSALWHDRPAEVSRLPCGSGPAVVAGPSRRVSAARAQESRWSPLSSQRALRTTGR